MYLAIITLPILGSVVSGFFGRNIGVSGAHLITTVSVIITTILVLVAFFEVGLNNILVSIYLIKWIDSDLLNVLWYFQFDSLTVSMLLPVLIVSSLVHVYSIGYMSHDPHNQRFFSYLSLFTFMMIILVTGNSYLLMFVGWEGVGVCSYLLVSFWFTRIAANQSSISAFLTNRVGDCLLTVGMFAIIWSFGNLDYSTVFSSAAFINSSVVTIIGICLFIGAMAKSSQVGLHVWLPMAMEGPTPVSALIHAATMVTAGVYLLMRSSPLIEYSSTVLLICLWLGAITALFSSLVGLFQNDIKKVIAYSTMSQLGMMVIAVGLSSYNVALFHLVNHAFYKALLFLGAGSVIHAVADNQDFRKYGGLRPYLPLTYSVILIASLSLVAFPYMTGFYSKDFILESAYGEFYFRGTVVYYIATIAAMFTTLYSVKVLYLTFLANPNGPLVNYKNNSLESKQAQEANIFMNVPLIILGIFSIFFGYITKDIFIGLGSDFFIDNSLFIHFIHELLLDTEFAVSTTFKLLPLIFTLSFTLLALILWEFFPSIIAYFKFSMSGYNISRFFNQRFYIELLYNKFVNELLYYKLGNQTTMVIDKGSVELLGPFGLEVSLIALSKNISSLSLGIVVNYALFTLIGLILFIYLPYLNLIDYSLILISLLYLSLINTKWEIDNVDNGHLQSKFGHFFFNNFIFKKIKFILLLKLKQSFTWPKIIGGLLTIVFIAVAKYLYVGDLYLDWSNLMPNIYIASSALFFRLFIVTILESFFEFSDYHELTDNGFVKSKDFSEKLKENCVKAMNSNDGSNNGNDDNRSNNSNGDNYSDIGNTAGGLNQNNQPNIGQSNISEPQPENPNLESDNSESSSPPPRSSESDDPAYNSGDDLMTQALQRDDEGMSSEPDTPENEDEMDYAEDYIEHRKMDIRGSGSAAYVAKKGLDAINTKEPSDWTDRDKRNLNRAGYDEDKSLTENRNMMSENYTYHKRFNDLSRDRYNDAAEKISRAGKRTPSEVSSEAESVSDDGILYRYGTGLANSLNSSQVGSSSAVPYNYPQNNQATSNQGTSNQTTSNQVRGSQTTSSQVTNNQATVSQTTSSQVRGNQATSSQTTGNPFSSNLFNSNRLNSNQLNSNQLNPYLGTGSQSNVNQNTVNLPSIYESTGYLSNPYGYRGNQGTSSQATSNQIRGNQGTGSQTTSNLVIGSQVTDSQLNPYLGTGNQTTSNQTTGNQTTGNQSSSKRSREDSPSPEAESSSKRKRT